MTRKKSQSVAVEVVLDANDVATISCTLDSQIKTTAKRDEEMTLNIPLWVVGVIAVLCIPGLIYVFLYAWFDIDLLDLKQLRKGMKK